MIRHALRYLKQRFRLVKVPQRPVLDAVDFGRAECVVLDVGANRGGFAGNVLLRAPLATVHCFEPNAGLAPHLRSAARRFGVGKRSPRCFVVQAAAGEFRQRAELIVTGLSAASSLMEVSNEARAGWPEVDFEERQRDTIDVIRLDDYLDANDIGSVKLLKLDVQGFELIALRGCARRLRDIEYIICEIQFVPLYEGAPLWHEIVLFLAGFEFLPVLMDGFCFSPEGRPLQADLLLRRAL